MPLTGKKIGVIGAGNMGLALVRGLIEGGVVPADHIAVRNRRAKTTQAVADAHGVRAAASNVDCVTGADVVLLGIKPQIFDEVLAEIGDHIGDALVLSVAAGIPTARMERALGGTPRVVRAMPNTPALIREGATALAAGRHATDADLELAEAILGEISQVVVVDEVHLDAITGLSGSGPAYVMLIIEAFADAGVKVGLSREVAQALAVQTIRGSARLLQVTGEHPGKLRDQVTSPGGTAIAGLHTMEEGGLRTTIMNAVEAAAKRARELGQE